MGFNRAHFLFVQSQLQALLSSAIAGLGFELVNAQLNGRNMRVFIDHPKGVNVDDCARVSEHLTRLFEVENVVFDRLEVSSPGLDRELLKPADFVRFAGSRVRVKLAVAIEGRKNFSGALRGLKDGVIELDEGGARVFLPLANVARTRLVPETPTPGRRKQ